MGQIDIKKLNIDELIGVVNLYPWFSGARRELCDRMSRMGDAWGEAQFADAALYIADRDMLADMLRKSSQADLSDTDAEKLLKSYISENSDMWTISGLSCGLPLASKILLIASSE